MTKETSSMASSNGYKSSTRIIMVLAVLFSLFAAACATEEGSSLGDQNQAVTSGGYEEWLTPVASGYFKDPKDYTVMGQMGEIPTLTEDGQPVTCVTPDVLVPQVFNLVLDKTSEVKFDGEIDATDPETGSVYKARSARICGEVYWEKSLSDPRNLQCPFQVCCTFTQIRQFPFIKVSCNRIQVSTLCQR